jgi:hypothetical protein
MKQTKLFIAVALIALAALWLSGCDSEPTGPTVVAASPSPSPTPDPKTDVNSCVQVDLRVTGYNGAGNPAVVFGVGELFVVQAHALNEAGAVLPSNCRASTFATWLVSGTAPCQRFGDQFSLSAYFWCIEPGTLTTLVRHGSYTSAWAGRIIR